MSKADTLFKKATAFERLALYSDRQAFLQALAQQKPLINPQGPQPTDPNMHPYTQPDWESERDREFGSPGTIPAPTEQPVQATEKVIKEFPPIDTVAQEALSRVTTVEGIGLPLKIDGKLGPETRKSLEAFKKRFDLSPTLSDKQVLQYAKLLADKHHRYGGKN